MTLEVREGTKPEGTDAWFWGMMHPDDEDDDLPLAWLSDLVAKPDKADDEA